MKLTVLPPDINRCQHAFVPLDAGTILYGLGAIKGLGASAIEAILEARAGGTPFADLFDLCRRVDARRVNRRVLESLIRAGALDGLGAPGAADARGNAGGAGDGMSRATLMASLSAALSGPQHSKNLDAGQHDLFGAAPRRRRTAAMWR